MIQDYDGFAVLDAMRKEENLRHIPILALTEKAMMGDRATIVSYGIAGYVAKPIDPAILP